MKNRIKELRKELNLNQTDFGDKIGVKQGSVAGYESGARTPIDAVITSICREFGVNELWLRQGVGEMFQAKSREEEMEALFTQLWREDPTSESFKSRFIAAALRAGPEAWAAWEKFFLDLAGETKKEEQDL